MHETSSNNTYVLIAHTTHTSSVDMGDKTFENAWILFSQKVVAQKYYLPSLTLQMVS